MQLQLFLLLKVHDLFYAKYMYLNFGENWPSKLYLNLTNKEAKVKYFIDCHKTWRELRNLIAVQWAGANFFVVHFSSFLTMYLSVLYCIEVWLWLLPMLYDTDVFCGEQL